MKAPAVVSVEHALEQRRAALADGVPPGCHHCATCGAAVSGGEAFVRHMTCSRHVVEQRARMRFAPQTGDAFDQALADADASGDVTRVLAVIEVWHRGPWDRRKGIFRWTGPERREK